MALKNYTTKISVEKSAAEIQGKLAFAGAKKIMSEYDDSGNLVALSFQLKVGDGLVPFHYPLTGDQ